MAQKTAREIAVDILQEIEQEAGYTNIVLKRVLDDNNHLIVQDKNLITEIINGTMKYKRKIDYVINHFSKIKVNKMKPVVRQVLRMSVYQILFLDKVPDSAICNEAVNIIKRRKMHNLSGFVNGVLRNIIRSHESVTYPNPNNQKVQYLGVMYSFPDWLIKFWLEDYSFEFVEELCRALNAAPDVSIRTNKLLVSKEELVKILTDEGVVVEGGKLAKEALKIKTGGSIGKLDSFKKGYLTVQDESSMLVAHVLNPKPGEHVLDVCGAPGGKSTHLAELMKDEGLVVSADIYDHKIRLIDSTAKRLGHKIVKATLQDATKENKDFISKFHRVLIDAPCSGLGILQKKSDIRWKKEYNDIKELVKLQREIVKTASSYVKPSGIMVYSTCTISKRENEDMVSWITKHLDFELESIDPYIPGILHNENSKKGYVQIFPNTADTDGFFIARFRKRGNYVQK